MNKREYCINCEEKVNYKIIDKEYEFDLNNIKVKYNGKAAICEKCGEELTIDEIENYNQAVFEKAYKEEYNIISIDDINKILTRYNIGKRPLSMLLGWGEVTIARYFKGYIPSEKNSKILKKILNNPQEYYSILLTNKSNIKEIAYKKSLSAVEELLKIKDNESKINDETIEKVASYIIGRLEVTPMALQKLLYYIQLFSIGLLDLTPFASRCNAWEHGPVFGKIYYKYKEFKYNVILEEDTNIDLDSNLKEITDLIIKYFGCFNGKVLEYFTHNEEPWIKGIKKDDKIIEKNELKSFSKKNYQRI